MKKFLQIIGIIIIIAGVALGAYVGIGVMFIKPILSACAAFDAGTLTGSIVGLTVVKCIFAGVVGTLIGCVGVFVGEVVRTIGIELEKYARINKK